jgi:hypothetical protein
MLDVLLEGFIMTATITAIAPATAPMLTDARQALVGTLRDTRGKVDEGLQAYANSMCAAFNTEHTPWYDLKGKLGKGVKIERAAFVEDMKGAGYEQGTIDVYWGRVKDKSGRVKVQNKVSAPKDIDAEILKGLQTMLNKIYAAEDNDADCKASKFKGQLLEAFAGLGGDIMELG